MGLDLDAAHERLQQRQEQQRQIAAAVQALRGDYPAWTFTIIAKPGETGIEAVPGPGYEGDLVAVIRPDADGIREVLDAALRR